MRSQFGNAFPRSVEDTTWRTDKVIISHEQGKERLQSISQCEYLRLKMRSSLNVLLCTPRSDAPLSSIFIIEK